MGDRNVILVTADSLRADNCGWMRHNRSTTPTLDRLANDSLVLENAVSAGPRTPSSSPVLLSGEHFGVTEGDIPGRSERVRAHLHRNGTVATRFREAGYSTFALSVNPWTFDGNGFEQGFDRFVEVGTDRGGWLPDRLEDTALESPARYIDYWLYDKSWFCTWHSFFDQVRQTLRDADEPYFLWIFLMDTHNPFLVPRRDRHESSFWSMYSSFVRGNSYLNSTGRSAMDPDMPASVLENLRNAYRDAVRSTDRFVEELWQEAHGDDPVLVFSSDHGEAFHEHGTFGHQQVLYEENIHVPLLVHNAGPTGRVSRPFSLAALPELLLDCGPGDGLDPAELGGVYAVARTEDETTTAVRSESWKYIRSGDHEELYNLKTDPGETDSLLEDCPTKREELRRVASEFLDGLPRIGSAETDGKQSRDVQNLLESLGYVQ